LTALLTVQNRLRCWFDQFELNVHFLNLLGMFLDADTELDKIDPFNRAAPEVLATRLGIYPG
jgi:hypothetical protein